MAYEAFESARDNFGKFIHQFQPETKTLIRNLERILDKLYRQNLSLLFNETCLNERLLPNYTHTHTHTHAHIYIIWICVCLPFLFCSLVRKCMYHIKENKNHMKSQSKKVCSENSSLKLNTFGPFSSFGIPRLTPKIKSKNSLKVQDVICVISELKQYR